MISRRINQKFGVMMGNLFRFRLARRQLVHTLISRETIKPSSPTPSHLKTYNLSALDMFSPPVNMPLVIFYPNYGSASSSWEKATQLKRSLSQTLTHYYPFSGRLVDGGANVDCNDDGAEFVEARIDVPLSEFVDPHVLGYQPLDQLFPTGRIWGFGYNPSSRLLMVQLSHFACGGLALAVSLSHKLADAFGLCIFVDHWAAVNQQNFGDTRAQVLPPHFISSPRLNDDYVPRDVHIKESKFVTKKFVFPNTKVAQLKAKVIEGHIPGEDAEITMMNPTRVEVLHSLLHGCAVRAAKANPGNSIKTFILTQLVNLRRRMVPQVPENAVGNFYWTINIPITTDESELELKSLVARIKTAKMQLSSLTDSQLKEMVTKSGEAEIQSGSKEDVEVYWGSSVCWFPIYQVDFGWGKPIRATIAGAAAKNAFIFMDTPSGDGIEALVALEEQDMTALQSDHQLLEYAL